MVKHRPTSNDVAQQAGVSQATVSYVFSETTNVSIPQKTRKRVLQAADELGYRPNRVARALQTGRTNIVAVCLRFLDTSYTTAVMRYLHQQITQCGYNVMIGGTLEASDCTLGLSQLAEWGVDGVIAVDARPNHIETFSEMTSGAPVPLVNLSPFPSDRTDHVRLSLGAGTRTAIEHLLSIGCQRIVYASWEVAFLKHEPRKRAYDAVMQEAGGQREYLRIPHVSRREARERTKEYINQKGCPDGIFCHNDYMALGVLAALHDLNLTIPDQVAIVGHDGMEDSEYTQPPLSTVSIPIQQMCEIGWEFLQRRMENPDIPVQETTLRTRLVVRTSSLRR